MDVRNLIVGGGFSTASPRLRLIVGAALGLSLIGLMARYLRRRRRKGQMSVNQKLVSTKNTAPILINGDVKRSASPAVQRLMSRHESVSLSSDRLHSAASVHVTDLTPQQSGVMGLEALETAISYFEEALLLDDRTRPHLIISDEDKQSYNSRLQNILDMASALRHDCEKLFLHHNSVLFHDDASVVSASVDTKLVDNERRTITSISSVDSFLSAQAEIADLREFDEFGDLNVDIHYLAFYQLGLRQLEMNGVPCRSMRTELLACHSDADFLAKLHCVRLAFQLLLTSDNSICLLFAEIGRQIIVDLLLKAEQNPKDVLVAFDDLVAYASNDSNWPRIEDELRTRGVRCMTFFDIVLDFIFLDAFEDLENPPSSVIAVVQNRWLSNGFKEMALSTAVWSVLKAKRRILKFPDGFISRFYSILEHVSPILCWGFLGPESGLKDLCYFFKDQVFGFLRDIFNLHRTKYTTIDDLAKDIVDHAKSHYELIVQRQSC